MRESAGTYVTLHLNIEHVANPIHHIPQVAHVREHVVELKDAILQPEDLEELHQAEEAESNERQATRESGGEVCQVKSACQVVRVSGCGVPSVAVRGADASVGWTPAWWLGAQLRAVVAWTLSIRA